MNPVIKVRLRKDELNVYKDYFSLVNLHREEALRLNPREVDLAAAIAYLGPGFSLEPRSKNAKNFDMIRQITDMSSSMISQYVGKLLEKKVLRKDEDRLITLAPNVAELVKVIKYNIEQDGKFSFNYNIEYEVH